VASGGHDYHYGSWGGRGGGWGSGGGGKEKEKFYLNFQTKIYSNLFLSNMKKCL